MNKTAAFLIFASILSCGDSPSSSSASKSVNDYISTEAGKFMTKYSEAEIVQCSLRDIDNNQLDYNIRNNSNGSQIDISISASLSRKITADLQLKGQTQRITPSRFWSALDSNIAKELNEVIVESDIKRNYGEFIRLQKEIAFAYTVYIENPTFNEGYRLLTDLNGEKRSTVIAFTDYTKAVRDISPCSSLNIDSIKIDDKLLKPSDITARISCQNRFGESLLIDEYRRKEIYLSIKSNELIEDFILRSKQLQIYKDSKRSRQLIYAGDYNYDYILFDIDKVRSSKPNSIESIDLEIAPTGTDSIDVKNLNCITIKELTL